MDEGRALAEIEEALTREDPTLAARLASFTVGPTRKVRVILTIALLALIMLVAAVGGWADDGDGACDTAQSRSLMTGGQSDARELGTGGLGGTGAVGGAEGADPREPAGDPRARVSDPEPAASLDCVTA